jgi:putative FmdB family regulatory protein
MPIFDYKCSDCGKTYDVFHKVREVLDDVVGPHCGSANPQRLMSVPSVAIAGKSSAEFDSGPSCGVGGGCCGGSCDLN